MHRVRGQVLISGLLALGLLVFAQPDAGAAARNGPNRIQHRKATPTHFTYKQSRGARGGLTGHIRFPKRLAKRDKRRIAAFGPNRQYNPIYVTAKVEKDGSFEVGAESYVVGGLKLQPRKITGSNAEQVQALRLFSSQLKALSKAEKKRRAR